MNRENAAVPLYEHVTSVRSGFGDKSNAPNLARCERRIPTNDGSDPF
jgi:hypothetical protein